MIMMTCFSCVWSTNDYNGGGAFKYDTDDIKVIYDCDDDYYDSKD